MSDEMVVRCHSCNSTLIWKRNERGEIEVYHDCSAVGFARGVEAAAKVADRVAAEWHEDAEGREEPHWKNISGNRAEACEEVAIAIHALIPTDGGKSS